MFKLHNKAPKTRRTRRPVPSLVVTTLESRAESTNGRDTKEGVIWRNRRKKGEREIK